MNMPILREFPTKQPRRKLISEQTWTIRNQNVEIVTVQCTNEISRKSHTLWTKTTDAAFVSSLDKSCLESENLFIHQGAPMKITRNITDMNVCQGQLRSEKDSTSHRSYD